MVKLVREALEDFLEPKNPKEFIKMWLEGEMFLDEVIKYAGVDAVGGHIEEYISKSPTRFITSSTWLNTDQRNSLYAKYGEDIISALSDAGAQPLLHFYLANSYKYDLSKFPVMVKRTKEGLSDANVANMEVLHGGYLPEKQEYRFLELIKDLPDEQLKGQHTIKIYNMTVDIENEVINDLQDRLAGIILDMSPEENPTGALFLLQHAVESDLPRLAEKAKVIIHDNPGAHDPDDLVEVGVELRQLDLIQLGMQELDVNEYEDVEANSYRQYKDMVDFFNGEMDTNFRAYSGEHGSGPYTVVNVKGRGGIFASDDVRDELVRRGYDREAVEEFLDDERYSDMWYSMVEMTAEDMSIEHEDFVVVGRSGGYWGTEKQVDSVIRYDNEAIRKRMMELEEDDIPGWYDDIPEFLREVMDFQDTRILNYLEVDKDDDEAKKFKELYDDIEATVKAYEDPKVWADEVEARYEEELEGGDDEQ